MPPLKNREKILLVVGIPTVLIVLAWNFLSPPAAQTTQAGQLPTNQALSKLADVKKENTQMHAQLDKMEPSIEKMSYQLPAEQLLPRVIRDIQTMAAKSGVHLREIKPIRPKRLKSGVGVRVPVEVRFKATFQPDAVRFLYHIEEADSKMVVDKINITSADARFKSVEVSATITVFTTSLAGVAGGEGDKSNASSKSNRG